MTISDSLRIVWRRPVAAIETLRDRIGVLAASSSARSETKRHSERLALLDRVSSVLASSLDYQRTVATTAELAVPALADWASVDVLVGNEIKQLAAASVDDPALRHNSEVRARYSVDANAQTGLAHVLRTGETMFTPDITDAFLVKFARSPEHLASMRAVRPRSAMVVPMIARGRTIGVLTTVSISRPFDQESLALARDIALRAAVAIDNAQLYQASVVANETKANFLATMSHELRTPLTAIIGCEGLLAEGVAGELNDGQKQQLDRIKVSAQHLLTLIEEILLYTRIDTGRATVHFEELEAHAAVKDAIIVVTPMAGHLTLTSDIDPKLALRTDRDKLRQMLINVIDNAVKFTEHGSVTVRAFERDANVVFEVQDTGIGLAPENLERVFEPFWQVEQQKSRRFEGAGMGLSTARKLAKLVGGDMSVESRLGVGSTFRIVVPKQPVQQ